MTVCSAIKRLSFGINVAPENYQHIISQVIADIEGVVNIADDLIVTIQYNTNFIVNSPWGLFKDNDKDN